MGFLYASNGMPVGHTSLGNPGASRNSNVQITAENGSLKIRSPYSAEFVQLLKTQIPAISRKWDNTQKAWLVSPKYSKEVEQICQQVYGVAPVMPTVIGGESAETFETTLRAEYVGNCNSNSGASSVYCNGGWNAKIPEKILRTWFKQAEQNAGTLYGLLGCDEKASLEEIKKAYKRAARQWHPDVCKEENASEMFQQIKSAFDTLINQESRAKYNAGLFFERMTKTQKSTRFATFTPVLRCGAIKCRGKKELGTFIVEEILAWEDITNEYGQTMVSFWNGDSHSVMWV